MPVPDFHANARTTPARLTANATAKLPRYVLFGLCLVYIVSGLFLRSPWKTDDVIGLAQMWTAVHHGGSAWLLPEVAGVASAHNGPLPVWVGGGMMTLLGPWLGDIIAGRLPNLLWFALTATSLWYGAYLLGRRTEAQPLALPFGGQPGPRDYGRMLADAALLLLLGTLGLAWRSHETSAVPAALAFQALAFYSLARTLDRPLSGVITLGVAAAGAFLSRGMPALLPLLPALALVPALLRAPPAPDNHSNTPGHPLLALVAPLLALGLILAWWLPANATSSYWMTNWIVWQRDLMGLINTEGLVSALRNLPWFLWPLWPLALVAIWRWRDWVRAPHMAVPLSLAAGGVITLALTRHPGEPEWLALVIPGATLGALALPTLRRGLVNTLDWFALMAFSVAGALVWFGWSTALTGWPVKIAGNIERQTPGYVMPFIWWATLLAVVGTACWGLLVMWRLRTHPAALWRGSVLSAGGVVLTWVLLTQLWMPSIDYARSYRPVSQALSDQIAQARATYGAGLCVRTSGLGLAQRASFAVHHGLSFSFDPACPLLLQQTTREALALGGGQHDAGLLWEGGRPSDRHEVYRLIRVAR